LNPFVFISKKLLLELESLIKQEMKEPQDLQKLLTHCTEDSKLLTYTL